MTLEQRIAITECVRLVELLVNSSTPHAKELGMIVIMRLAAVGRHGPGAILSEEEAAMWSELAHQNEAGRPGAVICVHCRNVVTEPHNCDAERMEHDR